MFRWLPKNFGVRSLLIFVALVAFALVASREWTQWKEAHYRYKRALGAWSVSNIRTPVVVGEAEALYNAELRTLWIPNSFARRRHSERLSLLADRVEAFATNALWGSWEGKQEQHRIAEQLRARVAELSSD